MQRVYNRQVDVKLPGNGHAKTYHVCPWIGGDGRRYWAAYLRGAAGSILHYESLADAVAAIGRGHPEGSIVKVAKLCDPVSS